MRQKDPKLMKQIYDFAEEFYFSEGYSPSTSVIAKSLKIGRTTAYSYLVAMDEMGMISYDGKLIATDKMRKTSHINRSVGIYDKAIPCGELETIDAAVSEYVDLPSAIFGNGELYILRTYGTSMLNAGIEPGDLVVIEKAETAKAGEIVVALGNQTDSSLKRLQYDEEQQRYYLHPENDSMEDIYVEDLKIQGVARFVIKSLK